MKALSVIIVPVLSLLLSVPGGYSPEELATIFRAPSGDSTQDQEILIEIQEDFTQTTQILGDSILGVNGLLSTISSSVITKRSETKSLSATEQDAWTQQMELILQQSCQAFIHALNLNGFLSANAGETKEGNISKIEPHVAVTTIAIGTAIVSSLYYLFSKTKENLDNAQYIVYQTAEIGSYHREQVVRILNDSGIYTPANASASQLWETFKASDYKKRRHAAADLKDWVVSNQNIIYNSDLAQDDQDRIVAVTIDQGKVATKVVVDSSLTVLNAGWSSLIPGELPGAVIDITTAYYGAGPTDLFEKTLNMAAVSGNQNTLTIPTATMSIDEAKQVLAELQEQGADGVSGSELDNALWAYGTSLAKLDPDRGTFILTYPEYSLFQQVHLTQNVDTPEKMTGTLQIPEKYLNYFFDFLYTGTDGVVEWFKSYHQALNQEIVIPQITEGADEQECLQWQDGICVVPVESGDELPGVCGTSDVSLTDHQGNTFCLSHFLNADQVEPQICARTITTPDDWNGSSYYTVTIKSLSGAIAAQCSYARGDTCNGSTTEPDYLLEETIETSSGSSITSWIVYEDYSCNSYYHNSFTMYDSTYDPGSYTDNGKHGLFIEYHGQYAEMRTTPSPCHDLPLTIAHYSHDVPNGSNASFICDEQDGKSYLSLLGNHISGKAHGLFQSYYSDTHTLEWQATYENDKKHGLYQDFYKNGNVSYSCEYNYDLKHGEEWIYHEDGSISLNQYVNDLYDGQLKDWDADGNLIRCEVFSQGNYVQDCP